MTTINFETDDALFQFEYKAVMECIEHRKSIYDVQELDNLIDILSNQPEQNILSSAEHQYFGYIALDLINDGEGSVVCKICNKHYDARRLKGSIKATDEVSLKDVKSKKGGFKNLFLRKTKPPGMQGGKGYKCPRSHTLIFMITWRT